MLRFGRPFRLHAKACTFHARRQIGQMRKPAIDRYALYGEQGASLPPEFVHLERIFDRSSLHDWTIAPHAHPHMLQLLLVESGAVEVHDEDGSSQLTGPALILIPPSSVHAFHFDPAVEGWVLSLAADMIHDPRIAGVLTGLADLQQTQAVALEPHSALVNRLEWLLTDLAERLRHGQVAGLGLLAQVALILVNALETAALRSNSPNSRTYSTLIVRFRTLVEEHYRDHWAISVYAQALGTTPSTLTRAARAQTGQAPADLVHDRLLLESKRNLAFTGASVAQIAYALGFADPAYFARFFKARTGQTASDFRRAKLASDQQMEDAAEQ